MHLLHRAVDLLLRMLQGLLPLLELLLLDRGGRGSGGGGFDAAACECGDRSDGEKCLHGQHYRRQDPTLPRQKFLCGSPRKPQTGQVKGTRRENGPFRSPS